MEFENRDLEEVYIFEVPSYIRDLDKEEIEEFINLAKMYSDDSIIFKRNIDNGCVNLMHSLYNMCSLLNASIVGIYNLLNHFNYSYNLSYLHESKVIGPNIYLYKDYRREECLLL